jgi:hypothetical protein
MQAKQKAKVLYLGILLCLGSAAEAAVIGCNTDATPSVLAVNNEFGAYCVSDFGWSNTWYSVGDGTHPIPSVYDQELDLFSGDDAVNLSFGISDESGSIPVTGKGWLTPTLDAGALFPFYDTDSVWTVRSPVRYTTSGDETKTQSVIELLLPGLGVVETVIDTEILADGAIRQFYTITNNADTFLTDLTFADYFNFHPNGALIAATKEAFTSIEDGTVTVIGNLALPSYIGNGQMHLIDANGNALTPTRQDIGCADVLGFDADCAATGGPSIPRVESGTYNNLAAQTGPGDFAGALAFDSGTQLLAPSASVTFGLEKRVVVPEPAALALLGAGLIALARGRGLRSASALGGGAAQ